MTTDKHGAESAGSGSATPARDRLVAAFDAMLLARNGERGRAKAIAAHAGVSRTTFYDHFQSPDDLELVAMRRPLGALAALCEDQSDIGAVGRWLAHFWEYRSEARKLFSGPKRARLERELEALIRARMAEGEGAALFPIQAAATIISSVEAWVHSRIVAKPVELASQLHASCTALRRAGHCNG